LTNPLLTLRRQAGESLNGLARITGLDRRTIKSYERLPRLGDLTALRSLVHITTGLGLTMTLVIGGIEVDLSGSYVEDVDPGSGNEKFSEPAQDEERTNTIGDHFDP